jgi:hypothetical protein
MKRGPDHTDWEDDNEDLDGDEVWFSTEEP